MNEKLTPFAYAVAEAVRELKDAKDEKNLVNTRRAGLTYAEWATAIKRYKAAKKRFRECRDAYATAISEVRRGYNPTMDENAVAVLDWVKTRGLGI